MTGSDAHADLDARVHAISADIVRWRHHLHRNPELSNREGRTAAYVAEYLRTLRPERLYTGVAGNGVIAVLHGAKPGTRVAALRADMDALPVQDLSGVPFASTVTDESYPGGPFPVSHACGHDCHMSMLMGAAAVLAGMREALPGTVMLVFQPAEEGPPLPEPGGARELVKHPIFRETAPTMAFGMHVTPHPKGTVGYCAGNQYAASCLVKITLTGEQAHGSTPWNGTDPMPAAGAILTGIGQIYRRTDAFHPITVSIGHVQDIGRFNIIGATATLWGTIRCTHEQDMAATKDKLAQLVSGTAAAYGCAGQAEYLQDVPAVHNQEKWVTAALPTLRRAVGQHNIFEATPTLVYDDVSELVNRFGGLYLAFGVQDTELDEDGQPREARGGRGLASNHSPYFYADDDALEAGARVLAHVAYDHLTGAMLPE